MEIKIKNIQKLKKIIEVVSDLIAEGTFVFKKGYLELVALSSNNVIMVIFKFLSKNFIDYKIKEDVIISLSIQNLYTVLKSCDENLDLKFIIIDNKLKIISGDNKNNRKEFELTLIEFSDENLQKIPKLNFSLKIVSESQIFTKALNDLAFIEDGVTFKADKKNFSLAGKSSDISGKIDLQDKVKIENKDNKDYYGSYSMEYLKKFTKCDKIVKDVEIEFGQEYPLKIDYKEEDSFVLSFIIAPRNKD